MQKNTVIVTNNNLTPKAEICLVQVDTTVDAPEDVSTTIDYDTLSAPEKIQFDDCMAMLISKIPA